MLGPLLFLLYINNLPNCSNFLMVMYADDTTLYCNIDRGHTSSTMINDELKKISRWLAANKPSLNVKIKVFHTARKRIDYRTINRLKYIYPQHILHMLYNTLILPHLITVL